MIRSPPASWRQWGHLGPWRCDIFFQKQKEREAAPCAPGIRSDLTPPVEPLVGERRSLNPESGQSCLVLLLWEVKSQPLGCQHYYLTGQSEGCSKEDSWPLLGMCPQIPAASPGEDPCHLRIGY